MTRIGLGNDRHNVSLEWVQNGWVKRMRGTNYRNISLKISALNKAKKLKAAHRETTKRTNVNYIKICRGGMRNLHYLVLKDDTDFIPQLSHTCEHTHMCTCTHVNMHRCVFLHTYAHEHTERIERKQTKANK